MKLPIRAGVFLERRGALDSNSLASATHSHWEPLSFHSSHQFRIFPAQYSSTRWLLVNALGRRVLAKREGAGSRQQRHWVPVRGGVFVQWCAVNHPDGDFSTEDRSVLATNNRWQTQFRFSAFAFGNNHVLQISTDPVNRYIDMTLGTEMGLCQR